LLAPPDGGNLITRAASATGPADRQPRAATAYGIAPDRASEVGCGLLGRCRNPVVGRLMSIAAIETAKRHRRCCGSGIEPVHESLLARC